MIRLEHMQKTFSNNRVTTTAVKDVSLEINKGEIFGIIGFSGAGKSTLVRCINLLERPTSGSVYFQDTDLTKLSDKALREYRRHIGMIFQQFNLLAQRTVIDNITFPLEVAGVSKTKARERARELLKIVELSDKENSYPAQLSGGQKQRVAIARALATEPEVLLCDEATSALDPITTKAILALLKEINKTLGVTIIVITHEMKVVEQICDRVAVMNQGVVEEQASVQDFFLNPKSETGKKLVRSTESSQASVPKEPYIRLVFDGQASSEPVLADLILNSGERLNILGANTEDIGGSAYGQMLIEIPSEAAMEKIRMYLHKQNINFEEVEVTRGE